MSDLISRSELLKRLKEWNTSDETDKALYNFAFHRIIEQPTAYDIDKVVDELEEKARTVNVIGCGTIFEAINKDVAIKIVQQGGVSDDVCEWEYISGGEFIKNPHTNRFYSNEPSMKNVYCNTCGKKIKVVE